MTTTCIKIQSGQKQQLYDSYGKFLPKSQQELFIRKEREARWERLQTLKKISDKFDTIFNPDYTGGFHKFLQKSTLPRQTHVDHCQQGIKETNDLLVRIHKERENTEALLGKCFISLKPKKNMDEQIKHYRDHLDQLRNLKEKLMTNQQKLNGTLAELRKIFKLKVRSRDKSNLNRKKRET